MRRILGKDGTIATVFLASLTALLAALGERGGTLLDGAHLPLLHTFMEACSVTVSMLIFAVGWRSYGSARNDSQAALSCLFLGVGLLNLLHLLSYPEMRNLITPNSHTKAMLLSLAARALAALALLLAVWASAHRRDNDRFRYRILAGVLATAAALIWLSLWFAARHPDALDAGRATFNTAASAVLALWFVATGAVLLRRGYRNDCSWVRYIGVGGLVMALGEINFALQYTHTDVFNFVGHLCKIAGGYFIYRAVFTHSVQLPLEQLSASEALLRSNQHALMLAKVAADRSGDYIYMVDPSNGRIIYANAGACRRMGYSAEEILELHSWDINPGSNPELATRIIETMRERGSCRFEGEHRTRSGEIFPVEVTSTQIHHEGHEYFYSTVRDISERKAMEAELAQRAQHLRRVIDGMPYFVSLLTPDGRYVEANQMVANSMGASEAELRGKLLAETMGGAFSRETYRLIADSIERAAAGATVNFDLRASIGNNNYEYVSYYVAPVLNEAGTVINLIATAVPITERIRAQSELKLASTVFDHSAEAILITDSAIRVLSVNRAFTTLTGFAQNEMIDRVPPLFETGKHLPDMLKLLEQTGNWTGEAEWLHKDGRLCFEWVTVTKVRSDGEVSNYIVIFSDITEKKRTEEHIQYLAYYDPLTSLPNRVLLEDRIKQTIAAAQRESSKFAVIFLDLDHFKTINDSLGHQRGDKILAEVGKRLKRSVREMDTVARLGGDEFVLVLPGLQDGAEAAAIGQKLMAELAVPYLTGGSELRLTVSVGISVFPDDGADFSRLIMNADAAMYHAKAIGRNNIQFFIDEMNVRAAELLTMENRLRRGIERNEFVLHYQPQVDLRSGAIVGMEALVRWNDPERGMIPPGDFIPVAEERGLIAQIGTWVLGEACRQNKKWQQAGLPRLPVAVNISATQFQQKNLVANVHEVLEQTGLEPRYLELEVTESVVMYDAEQLISTLEELRSLGVFLAVDDFGTGYSSLSYLKRFPIDKIKVDRSFVRDIPGDKDDYSIVRAIIGLSHQLSLRVVAEGVETVEQLDALRASGCDQYQGFLFSRPVTATALENLLREKSSLV